MDIENKNTIEVVLSPAHYDQRKTTGEFIVVVVDILRASTTICQAFSSGVLEIIPVGTLEDAIEYKNQGFLVAGERGGEKLDFADFGNSPFDFKNKNLKGKKIVFTTTNGTNAIEIARDSAPIVIGCFSNLKVLSKWISEQNKNIVILCAGWEDTISLEDSAFAGALIETLMKKPGFSIPFDSSILALELWNRAKDNPGEFLKVGSHFKRLQNLGAENDFKYCLTSNTTPVIPVMNGTHLINILK